jgi:hypothetical protein
MIDAKSQGNATVSIYDLTGKVMQNEMVFLKGGLQSVDMSLNNCKPGLYQIVFTQGTERQVSRIIVE